jgi:kinesin family protein 18/19
MEGFNASCFAYGATGAGKTCTMIGNEAVGAGVMVLTMRDIFDAMRTREDTKFDVVCSYLEVRLGRWSKLI